MPPRRWATGRTGRFRRVGGSPNSIPAPPAPIPFTFTCPPLPCLPSPCLPACLSVGLATYLPAGAYEYTFENALLIGWEDLGLKDGKLGDEDYDDIMYLIDFRTKPNPHVNAPGALLLLGGALAGLASLRRRRA